MTTDLPNLDAATIGWIDRFAPYGVVVTDCEVRVINWNRWMTTHSGLTPEQVIGRNLIEIFPDLVARRLEGHFQRALQGQVSVLSTVLHGHLFQMAPVSRDSQYPWMKQTARIGPLVSGEKIQGIIVVVEDVTQREWQAEVLREQHTRDEILSWALAHLLKSDDPRMVSRELFYKVATKLDFDCYMLHSADPDGSTFRLSAAGGLTPEAEESVSVLRNDQIPSIHTWSTGTTFSRDYEAIQMDPEFHIGKKLGFQAYVVLPLITGPHLLGFLTFATRSRKSIAPGEAELLGTIAQYLAVALNRERTDRELRLAQKRLNEHAQELETRVADRTASLKQIIAELQTFSYTVAHDLRAPIRALKGYCEVLLEDFPGEIPEPAIKVICKLRDASGRMDSLTRDLLEFSKISRQEIKLETIEIQEVVASAIEGLGSAAKLATAVVGPLPAVCAQRTLAHQCLTNLIQNALKFVTPGTVPKIIIRAESVTKPTERNPHDTTLFTRPRYSLAERDEPAGLDTSRIRIWVEDHGIGIPTEARQKIFGIFERGVNVGEFEGTGIGLAIVARAMERMGGYCGVEPRQEGGSRFWLEFRRPPESEIKPKMENGPL